MSLKRNILANYASQIYVTLISIVMVPLYLRYMGAEAFGLVGFFATLQMWFNLLDMGLTPTMARETARFRGGAMDAITFRRLGRALEWLFLIVALLGGGVLLTASGWVATSWLNAQHLLVSEVQTAIQLMAITVSLRWMSGLYRGQVSGAERLVWLGGYNAAIATIRFVGVLPVLMFISATPVAFFRYQLCAASIELVGLSVMAYRLLPPVPPNERLTLSWRPLASVLKFTLTMAFATTLWVVVTQADKLLLSTLLPLAEYGYFTLAVLVASGVMMISGPVSGAIMPHMAKLEAEGDHAGLIRVYRQSTQLVAVITGAAAITVAFFAEPLLWAWTGDPTLAKQAAPIMILYAVGNGILAVSAFPYYLQYAKGDLRLHLIGNTLFVVMMIPAMIWAVSQYGSVGAGYVWMVLNFIYFIFWVPWIHFRFDTKLNIPWFGHDVLTINVVAALVGYGLFSIMPHVKSCLGLAVELVGVGFLVMLSGACASSVVRGKAKLWLQQR